MQHKAEANILAETCCTQSTVLAGSGPIVEHMYDNSSSAYLPISTKLATSSIWESVNSDVFTTHTNFSVTVDKSSDI